MKLPTVEVVKLSYWTLLIRDKYRPNGDEWFERFDSREKAEAKAKRMIDKKLVTQHEETNGQEPLCIKTES